MQNTVTLQNDLNQYCEVAGSYQPCRKCEAEESLEKKELLVGVVTVSSWKPAATEEQPELKKKKKMPVSLRCHINKQAKSTALYVFTFTCQGKLSRLTDHQASHL